MWLPRLVMRLGFYLFLAALGLLGALQVSWIAFAAFVALTLLAFGAIGATHPRPDGWLHRLTPLPDLGLLYLLVAGAAPPNPWDGLAYLWVAGLSMNTYRPRAAWLVPAWGFAAWFTLVLAEPMGDGWLVWTLGHGMGLALLSAVALSYARERSDRRRDELTGALLRRTGLEELRRLVDAARPFQIAFIDLRAFKQVNDRHGHAVGDEVLAAVAGRLLSAVRDEDPVIRFGGDEFLVASGQHDLEERLRAALADPIHTTRGKVDVRADIGTSDWNPGASLDALVHEADAQMYDFKRRA